MDPMGMGSSNLQWFYQADAGRAAASTRRLSGAWNLSWNDGCEIRTEDGCLIEVRSSWDLKVA